MNDFENMFWELTDLIQELEININNYENLQNSVQDLIDLHKALLKEYERDGINGKRIFWTKKRNNKTYSQRI